jgi:C4-dicarboxylate transporter DctQ subunit
MRGARIVTEKVQRAVAAVLWLFRGVAAILLLGSVAINFANIIGRYFFSYSISWAEEIMLFLMVGCVFLGTAQVAWANRHIRMDVLLNVLPAPIKKAVEFFTDLCLIAVCVAITIFALPVIQQLAAFDERSQAANFPLVIPQFMIPFGLSVMAILVAIRMLVGARGSRSGPTH